MQKRKKNVSEEEMTAVYNQIDATETKIKELEQKSHDIRQQIASCDKQFYFIIFKKMYTCYADVLPYLHIIVGYLEIIATFLFLILLVLFFTLFFTK